MRAGRTLAAMPDMDAQIARELAAGAEVPQVAARYNVPEPYVVRIQEGAAKPWWKRRSWGIGPLVNRIVYTAVLAVGINLLIAVGPGALYGWYVGGFFFLVTTVIVAIRRR
jgi:hypothetical protein